MPAVLRLNFRSTMGDAPTRTAAAFFRFCADGTLRGPENYVVARSVGGTWTLSGRAHRAIECEGPLKLRLSAGASEPPVVLGPFTHVRSAAGMLYGDERCLNIYLPGRSPAAGPACHELTILQPEAA